MGYILSPLQGFLNTLCMRLKIILAIGEQALYITNLSEEELMSL
jgi:hypothetical protein